MSILFVFTSLLSAHILTKTQMSPSAGAALNQTNRQFCQGGDVLKIQLDTENKTIKLEKDVVLSKLIETLEKLLPHGEWKEFTLETHTVIHHWSNPVVIPSGIPYPVPPYPRPSWPWYSSPRLESNLHPADDQGGAGRNSQMMLKKGVYNIQA